MHTPETRAAQAWRKTRTGPNPTECLILETIERTGGLLIGYRGGARSETLADDTPLWLLGAFDVGLAIELGWLRPDRLSPGLMPGMPAQRYFATGRSSIEEDPR